MSEGTQDASGASRADRGGREGWEALARRAATASSEAASAPAGTVVTLDGRTGVTTGEGVLDLLSLQLEGRRPATASDFLQGYQDFLGSRLGT